MNGSHHSCHGYRLSRDQVFSFSIELKNLERDQKSECFNGVIAW